VRKLAGEHGISSAVMHTWLFLAEVDALGTAGRPPVVVDVDDVRARRARGETWAAIAEECRAPPSRRYRLTDRHSFPTGIRAGRPFAGGTEARDGGVALVAPCRFGLVALRSSEEVDPLGVDLTS
jgi:hypothetical protein